MKPPGLPDSPKLGSGGGGGCAAGIGDLRIEGANDQPSVKHGPPGSGGGPVAPGANRGSELEPVARQTADERQFQRFLEAADDLGSNLTSIFHDAFPKMVAPSVGSATPDTGAATPVTAPAPRPPGSVTPIENAKAWNRHGRPSPARSDDRPTEAAVAADEATNAALRFAEAMMIVLFSALDAKQRNALKRGFDSLLQKVENLDIAEASPGALQAQREILRAVEKMLAGKPERGLAIAPRSDIAKRSRAMPT
jgi:hypothetical protein